MAGLSILLGYALLTQDMIASQDAEFGRKLMAIPLAIRIPRLMYASAHIMNPLDWVFVAIGVWQGWKIPQRMVQAARGGVVSKR
jgi:hypothetical protein